MEAVSPFGCLREWRAMAHAKDLELRLQYGFDYIGAFFIGVREMHRQ
jgi:hypothetical protein